MGMLFRYSRKAPASAGAFVLSLESVGLNLVEEGAPLVSAEGEMPAFRVHAVPNGRPLGEVGDLDTVLPCPAAVARLAEVSGELFRHDGRSLLLGTEALFQEAHRVGRRQSDLLGGREHLLVVHHLSLFLKEEAAEGLFEVDH